MLKHPACTRIFLGVAWLALPLFCLAQTGLPDVIRIENAQINRDSGELELSGVTRLPEESSLTASVWFEGKRGLWKIAYVKGGRFIVRFDPVRNRRFLSGSYLFRAEFKPDEQDLQVRAQLGTGAKYEVAEYRLKVGDADTRRQDEKFVREHLGEILEEARVLTFLLGERCSYTITHAMQLRGQNVLAQKQDVLPAQEQRHLANEWNRFLGIWNPRYEAMKLDYKDYQNSVFLGLFPDADEPVGIIFSGLYKYYVACTGAVYKVLQLDLPPEIQANMQFSREQIFPTIQQTAARLYQVLGIEPKSWEYTLLEKPERGNVTGLTYESYAMKFRISLPNENWVYDFSQLGQTMRIRIRPKDAEKAKDTVVGVEIKDFPQSESPSDLVKQLEITSRERWAGYVKLLGKSISPPDPTMPGGVRPGYDIKCLAEEANRKFKVRTYDLFCRYFKRTYAVVCISSPENFGGQESDFGKICDSFMVLDDPRFAEKGK